MRDEPRVERWWKVSALLIASMSEAVLVCTIA